MLKVLFMGTPSFAAAVLADLVDAEYQLVGVYTRPDRRPGGSKVAIGPPVKVLAQELGVRFFQPESLRSEDVSSQIGRLGPDVIISAAYGMFLPKGLLKIPPLGCLNVHPSLLPKYRGPSPVASAILAGEQITGVTIMLIDEGMDTGPILAQRSTHIGVEECSLGLTDRLFRLGSGLLLESLPDWANNRIETRPQDHSRSTVTKLLNKRDGEIDWRLSSDRIARQIRAFHPWPGSFSHWRGRTVKIMEGSLHKGDLCLPSPPGLVSELPNGDIGIGTGDGVLNVGRIQMEGRKAITAREFISGYPGFLGGVLS